MDRRTFVATLTGGLLAAPLAAEGQQPGKIARVGFLVVGPAETSEEQANRASRSPLWPAMKELGWVYGQNVIAERRYGVSIDQLRTGAADLVRLKVDVVVVGVPAVAKIVQLEDKVVPIVISGSGADLVSAGLVASLARPGGTVTGMQLLSDDLIGKRLDLLKALVPNLSRVAWLRDDVLWPVIPEMGGRFDRQTAEGARLLGIALHANGPEIVRYLAYYLDKVLKGAKPADLPISQSTKFDLVINVKTAKTLSLTIPQSLLARADEVIQ